MVWENPFVSDKRIGISQLQLGAGKFVTLGANLQALFLDTACNHRTGGVLFGKTLPAAAGASGRARCIKPRAQTAIKAAAAEGGILFDHRYQRSFQKNGAQGEAAGGGGGLLPHIHFTMRHKLLELG